LVDALSKCDSSIGAAPQMGGHHDLSLNAAVVGRDEDIGRQFKLDGPGIDAVASPKLPFRLVRPSK
jgi:hypothetical protein